MPESTTDVIRDDSSGVGTFTVCREITSLVKHASNTSKDSGREEGH